MDKKTAGEIFKEIRKGRGIPRQAVSRAAGLSADGVRKIELGKGDKISLDTFRRLCAVLGVSPQLVLEKLPPLEGIGVLTEWSNAGRPEKNDE